MKPVKALEECRFVPNSPNNYDFTGFVFYARIVHLDNCVRIDLSQKKTFDRWSNSTNFSIYFYRDVDPIKLKNKIAFARKICRSKLFDFNIYLHTIDLT